MKNLLKDKAFGILTRNGFECMLTKDTHIIYLLDFKNMRKMNKENGHEKTNKTIRQFFKSLKKDYIIGRCYYGDEILIASTKFKNHKKIFKKEATKFDLKYKIVFDIYKGKRIKKFIKKLSNKLDYEKYRKS